MVVELGIDTPQKYKFFYYNMYYNRNKEGFFSFGFETKS